MCSYAGPLIRSCDKEESSWILSARIGTLELDVYQCRSHTQFHLVGRCVICVFPAASVILSLIFTVCYLAALWAVTARLSATIINR